MPKSVRRRGDVGVRTGGRPATALAAEGLLRTVRHLGLDDPRRTGPMLTATTAAAATDELITLALSGHPASTRFAATSPSTPPSPGSPTRPATRNCRAARSTDSPARYASWARPCGCAHGVARPQHRVHRHRPRRPTVPLGQPVRTPPTRPTHPAAPLVDPPVATAATIATRTLTAAGPLYLDDITAAITRARRNRTPPAEETVAAALILLGARINPADGRWTHPGPAHPKDAALVKAARQTNRHRHTWSQTITLLTAVGYAPTGAHTLIPRHPLIERTRPNHYRILGT